MENWSLRLKLVSLSLALCALSLIVGAVAFVSLDSVEQQYGYIAEITLPKIKLVSEMFIHYRGCRLYLSALQSADLTPERSREALEKIADFEKKFEAAKHQYVQLGFESGQKVLFDKVQDDWRAFSTLNQRALSEFKQQTAVSYKKMLSIMSVDFPTVTKSFVSDMNSLIDFHQKIGDQKVRAAKETAKIGHLISAAVIFAGSVLGLLIGFFFSNSISRFLTQIASSLAQGAQEVASASHQIAETNNALSASTAEQAASLQETASAVEEISAMVKQNSMNAVDSQAVSLKSRQTAETGQGLITEMIVAIEDLHSGSEKIRIQSEANQHELTKISEAFHEINAKTKVIHDIVLQTKLLSFNASVEAARAGSHGTGFSVVAEEMANLASLSGNAAKEITQLIDRSQKNVTDTVEQSRTIIDQMIRENKTKVDRGLFTAKNCGAVLQEIVANTLELSRRVSEIASASHEQSQGIQEISNAMAQLDEVTQGNSSRAHETSSASENLSTQADQLKSVVTSLRTAVVGRKPA